MVFSFTFFSYHLLQFSLSLFRYGSTAAWTNYTYPLYGLACCKEYCLLWIFLRGIRSIKIGPFAKRRVVMVVFWQRIWIIRVGWLITKRKISKQNPDWPAGCQKVGLCFCRESIFGWPFAQKRVCCQWCFGKESGSSGLAGLEQRRWFCTQFFLQSIFIIQMSWPVAKWMVLYKLFL